MSVSLPPGTASWRDVLRHVGRRLATIGALRGAALALLFVSPWLVNGSYPGWQSGEQVILDDPRAPGPDPREVGRGPLLGSLGRFKAIRLVEGGVCLEYEIEGAFVQEWVTAQTDEEHSTEIKSQPSRNLMRFQRYVLCCEIRHKLQTFPMHTLFYYEDR